MNNPLVPYDRFRPPGSEPMTPEVAIIEGLPPLQAIGDETVTQLARHTCLARLAREFVLDYDLVAACARAGLHWDDIRGAHRDPLFITMLRELTESLPADQVVSRTEVLMMLKREATTAPKASERIAAIERLAKLAGLELEDRNNKGGAPTINIHLTGGAAAAVSVEKNVTPPKLQVNGGEALL